MEFEKKELGLYQVLVIMEKVDLYNISEFKKILFDLTSGKYSHVAVELTANHSDMSSSVIGALISGQKKMSASKGTFILVNPSEHVKNLFFFAGLQDFFNTVENENQLI
jgi:anti-anti-sigma factor